MEYFAKCWNHDFALAGDLQVTTVETRVAYGNRPLCGGGVGAQENTQLASSI